MGVGNYCCAASARRPASRPRGRRGAGHIVSPRAQHVIFCLLYVYGLEMCGNGFQHSHSLPFPSIQFPFPPIPIPIFDLFPFPWDSHGIPGPIGNPIPMHISSTDAFSFLRPNKLHPSLLPPPSGLCDRSRLFVVCLFCMSALRYTRVPGLDQFWRDRKTVLSVHLWHL